MNVLAIDTSTNVLGVAVANEQGIIGEQITYTKRNHSVRAMPTVEALLKECGMKPADLNRIVVAKGPGSYTGVRIGVTIAKSLAWSLGIELVGISSLEALALNGRYFNGYVCPVFDARRGQLYTALFKAENGKITRIQDDQNVLAKDFADGLRRLDAPVLFVGSDASIHEETFKEALGDRALLAPAPLHHARAGELAMLGMQRPAEEIHSFVPNYVRLAEAEAKWLEAQEKQREE
ncbi:tRNA (adenosine(37)-N6)-threonylcarbamoyltransferase complex dimerization subunit type 1 TsaB [Gracilibacillus sp. Marseille-QA3620]